MKSSTEQQFFEEGDRRVYTMKSYRQVEAHREPVYRETPEVDQDVYREVDQDSTEAAYQEEPQSRPDGHRSRLRTMITEPSRIAESMPLTDGN